jgi:hypothetical protein
MTRLTTKAELLARATINRAIVLELNQIAPTMSLHADQQRLHDRAQTLLQQAIELEADALGIRHNSP